MIPKKIHYVWGHNEPKSRLANVCIASWVSIMPDFEILEWNQRTIDFEMLANESEYFRMALKYKSWAYIADYIRLKVLYEFGGVYLDTDMQVLKSLNDFTDYRFFAGFHKGNSPENRPSNEYVEAALLAAEPKHPVLRRMLDIYQTQMHFSKHQFIPYILTPLLREEFGLNVENERVSLKEGIELFPVEYFFPFESNYQGKIEIPKEGGYCIHWFTNSYAGDYFSSVYSHLRTLKGFARRKRHVELILKYAYQEVRLIIRFALIRMGLFNWLKTKLLRSH